MGLIFDTSELIAAERQQKFLADVIAPFSLDEGVGISVVTVTELQHGVRRAQQPWQENQRRNFLEDALTLFTIYPFTTSIARRLGDLDAELAMRGEKVDFADLVIAATVLELDFSLVTRNLRHFDRIPGLPIVSV